MSESSSDLELNWEEEASAVIHDVRDLVKFICVPDILPSSEHHIYLNLTTFEGQNYCIELSTLGFRVVGTEFNITTDDSGRYFDTPYALLGSLSPSYNKRFSESLSQKLDQISDRRQ